jgi:hypothetical protein
VRRGIGAVFSYLHRCQERGGRIITWLGLGWLGLDWLGLGWLGFDWLGLGWLRVQIHRRADLLRMRHVQLIARREKKHEASKQYTAPQTRMIPTTIIVLTATPKNIVLTIALFDDVSDQP